MSPARLVPLMGVLLLALGLTLGGTAPLARLALELGVPGLAVHLTGEPGLRGVALLRTGHPAEAAKAFEAAAQPYNHGLAAALSGDYSTALVAWERVLAATPADREARENHALVTALLATVEFDPVARPEDRPEGGPIVEAEPGQGKARASGQGDDATNAQTGFWMPEVHGSGLRRVPNIFDAQSIAATERWLETLEDQPGVYLRARLAAEQKGREAAGRALPIPEDPR